MDVRVNLYDLDESLVVDYDGCEIEYTPDHLSLVGDIIWWRWPNTGQRAWYGKEKPSSANMDGGHLIFFWTPHATVTQDPAFEVPSMQVGFRYDPDGKGVWTGDELNTTIDGCNWVFV